MFLERFKEFENFTITKLPLGGTKSIQIPRRHLTVSIKNSYIRAITQSITHQMN